jgi:hypothetical protein
MRPAPLAVEKREHQRHYAAVDVVWHLFEEDQAAPWLDMNLPSGWLLNSRRVLVPPVQRVGCERRD